MPLLRSIRPVLAVILSLSQFLPGVSSGRAIGLLPSDTTPPEISHTPLSEFPAGVPLRIQARVTDNVGIGDVTLIYRGTGDSDYRRVKMLEAPGSSIYSADLPDAAGPRIEYFIQATDLDGNTTPDLTAEPYVVTATKLETDLAVAAPPEAAAPQAPEKEGLNKWVWIGLGVAAVAVLAGGGGGGGGSNAGNGGTGTGTVTITAPVP